MALYIYHVIPKITWMVCEIITLDHAKRGMVPLWDEAIKNCQFQRVNKGKFSILYRGMGQQNIMVASFGRYMVKIF